LPAGIDQRAGGCQHGAEHLSEPFGQFEVVLALDSAAHRYDLFGSRDVDVGCFRSFQRDDAATQLLEFSRCRHLLDRSWRTR
jgi:hypothetical protein